MNSAQYVLVFLTKVYRLFVSPLLATLCGPNTGCRFVPTCSCYASESISKHGACRGSWLALNRLCRCHPWGNCGDGPVPPTSN